MTIKDVIEKTSDACKYISDSEPGIWHTTEWNICSHLQTRLNEIFSEYNVDVELVKHDGRRPDIVIHQRGNNSDNLVIFQAKKNPSIKDIQEDLDKIKETFFEDPYFYKFGILISIGELPDQLPDFDKSKIGIVEVYGWMLDESEHKSDTQL